MTRLSNVDFNLPFLKQVKARCPTFWKKTFEDPPEEPELVQAPDPKPAPTKEAIEAEREAERQERLQAALKCFIDYGPGERYRAATLESYKPVTESQRMVLEAIKAQSEGVNAFAENIVLFGPVGAGKDHLLIGLAKKAIVIGKTCRWCFGVELFRQLRQSMNGGSESQIIHSLTSPDILILSDPCPPESTVSDYQRSTLLEVLDYRYRNCLPTWATLNVLDRDDAEEKIGYQAIDRLWGEAIKIEVKGPSGRTSNK